VTSAMEENEAELRLHWPVLYHEPVRCGVDIPPGWMPLIRDLSEELEPMFAEFAKEDRPVIEQLKVKFGNLTVYVTDGTQEMHDSIARAGERADHTCMRCGKEGSGQRERGYMSVMCEGCFRS
jgi:hypothetical protein